MKVSSADAIYMSGVHLFVDVIRKHANKLDVAIAHEDINEVRKLLFEIGQSTEGLSARARRVLDTLDKRVSFQYDEERMPFLKSLKVTFNRHDCLKLAKALQIGAMNLSSIVLGREAKKKKG